MTTRTQEFHAAYLGADPELRWRGDLRGLWTALDRLAEEARPRWVWRVLPGGAWVGMRHTVAEGRVLRLARDEAPTTAKGPALWAQEVAVFLKHFGAEGWEPVSSPSARGVVATYAEPRSLL